MDTQAALVALIELLGLVNENADVRENWPDEYYRLSTYLQTNDAINRRLRLARRIADEVDGPETAALFDRTGDGWAYEWSELRRGVQQVIGLLEREAESEAIFEGSGP